MAKEPRNRLTALWDVLFDNLPQEWISFEPSLGLYVYPCYACRHLFSSLSSLKDHVNRRVLVLKYNCSKCPHQELTFYNRCSFLLHARQHFSLDGGEIDLSQVDITPLPLHLAGFSPNSSVPSLYEVAEEELVNDNVFLDAQFYSPDSKQKGNPLVVLTPEDFRFAQHEPALALRQVCHNTPKCQLITAKQQQLLKAGIVTGIKQKLNEADGIILPVISKVESLQRNLPRCPDCNTLQSATMAEHYLADNKPNNSSLSCSECRFIAPTKCSLLAHLRVHKQLPPYVCPDCGKDFPEADELLRHMHDVCFHSVKTVRFRCPGKNCSRIFATNKTFSVHFKLHLKCTYLCITCHQTFLDKNEVQDHAHVGGDACIILEQYSCPLCKDAKAMDEAGYEEHIDYHANDNSRCIYVFACRSCHSYFRSTTTYGVHLQRCSEKARHQSGLSLVTQRSCANSQRSLENRKVDAQLTSSLRRYCLLCLKQVEQDDNSAHRRVCKYAKPVVMLDELGGIDPSIVTSVASTNSDDSRKRKRIYIPNYHKKRKSCRNTEIELTAEEPMPFDGTYHCRLCSYANKERSEFHEHVKTHRDLSTTYQCMECGECFVVLPSLVKHLLHFHNISDYGAYLVENDAVDLGAVEGLKGPVREKQCRICLQEFEDDVLLNNHFRMHGMAFLRQNTK